MSFRDTGQIIADAIAEAMKRRPDLTSEAGRYLVAGVIQGRLERYDLEIRPKGAVSIVEEREIG